MAEANWYVVHTYSGYENKVKINIEKTVSNRHLEDVILDVVVPMQDVTEVTAKGVMKTTQKKLFPGYVLIYMVMNDDTWYIVRNTRGVTGFVGPGSKPVPLTEEEMRPFGLSGGVVTNAPKAPRLVVDFEEGDTVVVMAGAWEGTTSVITKVNPQRQTVTINVDLFGRETPVEINFAEVKKK
ncbi:MAG: transcription termination/antitermination factor NusG [Lachnospiraceae bacterium]|nr:transcription termination/antitermination factor NusG [Candidatus Equihabitans merdae]